MSGSKVMVSVPGVGAVPLGGSLGFRYRRVDVDGKPGLMVEVAPVPEGADGPADGTAVYCGIYTELEAFGDMVQAMIAAAKTVWPDNVFGETVERPKSGGLH